MNKKEAQEILDWCMEQEGLTDVKASVDKENFDRIAFNVSFHKSGKVQCLEMKRAWFERCNPQENLMSSEIRGILDQIRQIANKIQ